MQLERNCYQAGSLRKRPRKNGRPVWEFRYRDNSLPGSPMKQMTLSTVDYPSEAKARVALQHKLLDINGAGTFKQQNTVTIGTLIDRYKQEERIEEIVSQKAGMARNDSGLQYSTAISYRTMLEKHIRPAWESVPLSAVKPLAIDTWLRGLTRVEGDKDVAVSVKTRGHLKAMLHRLFERAMFWELMPMARNPMEFVEIRGISKRQKKPFVLTPEQYQLVVGGLDDPYKPMVQVAMCLGLRVSEVLALQWADFDFDALTLKVTRAAVHGRISRVKTEYSQDELPLDASFAALLRSWRKRAPKSLEGWVFVNESTGKVYHASCIQQDYIRAAGRKAKLGRDIGWHTFRHTYRSLLDDAGAPVGVQQKLMRHAQVATTMNVYGDAQMRSKRAANSNVVRMVLPEISAMRAAG